MKIWISKNSESPVREQIVAQIILGITSGDLPLGEKLPSTQDIARRFSIHPNTVSNAYQKLAERGWIEFRKGSGFFVCEVPSPGHDSGDELDQMIAEFLESAHEKGYSDSQLERRLAKNLNTNRPDSIVLIESDREFREILHSELSRITNARVDSVCVEELKQNSDNSKTLFVAMNDEKSKIQGFLAPGVRCVFLRSNSVADSMSGQSRPEPEDLIAVASGWEKFLIWAKTMLVAANIDPEALIIRSTADSNWRNGLDQASMIICDSLTATKFLNRNKVRVFPLIAEESLQTLRNILQR